MERPVRLAFCKLLFGYHGGTFTSTGLPITGTKDVRGACDRAYDCGECSLLREWIISLASQGWEWGWECDKCLKDTLKADRNGDVMRSVQGFYQEGRTEHDPDDLHPPTLAGCTRCGWESSFIQLVLRKPK